MIQYNALIFLIICLNQTPIGIAQYHSTKTGSFDNLNCPGLNSNRNNIHLQCFNRSEIATDCSFGMPPGSTANYSCPKYFKSSNPNKPHGGRIHCREGEWKLYSEFMRFACVPICGQWNRNDGVKLAPPWHVEIRSRVGRGLKGKCQGTLIPSLMSNASTVITSRSCVLKVGGSGSGNRVNGSHLSAVVGQTTSVKYTIEDIFFPEKDDLAILRLSKPVVLSDGVLPVCILPLANSTNEEALTLANPGKINGLIFGMEPSSKANTLVNLTTLSPEGCSLLGFTPGFDEFCALKRDSYAPTCTDIFQPFLVQSSSSSTYYIYGVPKGTLQVNSCPHQGVVYTNVSTHGEWIHDTLRQIDLRKKTIPQWEVQIKAVQVGLEII